MQEERTNVPKIRFKGYAEDWEQCKLGELVKITSGWAPSYFEEEDSEGDLFIKVDDLNYSTRVQNDSKMKVIENRKYKKMSKGSVIFPKRGAAIMTNKIRVLGKNAYMDTNMMALEAIKINSEFLYTFIDRTGLFKIADTSTIPQINNKHIEPYQILLPSPKEQAKIGLFFKQLDNTIALQQRKLDLLKETKKGFLQKMFPKNGAKVPEIRFPGFTEDWEQRKLGDVLTVSKEKNKSNSYSKEQILSVSREVGTVNQIEYQGRSFAGADISGYKIVYPGQLIYTKSPLKGAPYGIFQLVTEEGIVSPLYAVYNSTEQALASFIGLQLKSDNIATHYLSPLVSKGAKNTINITDEGALDGRVTYPTITEQQKIVAFFKQLENTITLHQRELDSLKEMKKSLLQQMFV
ncbi:restriction endonuclease subunit S [Enterococcus faecium]|uniref:restriction endonuclease subunit S n=1 Tax=Enterococcus faecium TaxID=1352 RepID=UPI00188465B2|nr:restriction endonuclease subunit S [Enterococcus faecium]EME7088968.1 restriction endonuclease subunit S [Enterococcus faecium]MBE9858380.1 restriction endonuclease subunit S [Enterococcus faecium]MBE9881761.1 restriction endonuclease subunit S [Enterococcus faecium]